MIPKMEPGVYERMKKSIETHIKTYEDPELDANGKRIIKARPVAEGDNEESIDMRERLELGEGVLKVNLGIPIIVVCNKVDLLIHGEKAKYLAENMDFIQQSIREYALHYGATVVFTSTIANKNLKTYYQYMLHRIYNFEFPVPANITDKDSLFIPAGFDSQNQIEALKKGIIGILGADGQPLSFEDVIKPPHMQSSSTKGKGVSEKEAFVECPEWY
jgi:dynein light intermediate chain 1, cytosolic